MGTRGTTSSTSEESRTPDAEEEEHQWVTQSKSINSLQGHATSDIYREASLTEVPASLWDWSAGDPVVVRAETNPETGQRRVVITEV